ncbi:LysM peptidoglycan-binding domain-containing protein [Runella slithyformis]|uniref:Peptidoglycan-binding lysin domain protein n=1 Tax=Runella slithyformis (strain ATCC 29530 / DSM 19594 / LMG 11500 / NCIMB 11436 / LSU 4) TaxID=761193 RepID=A0A7U3ZQE8_RUNSL|nr:LysM peptidoglycan-binding domain-containing protein [Runella slithyformis]AEI51471.1 Peptidoglycan-binding lysin domain protein [Runella slithyformis DSM 19594]
MIKRFGFFLAVLGLLLKKNTHATPFRSSLTDSTRTETKNGQSFVLHKVESGQTLYAVMRKYKTTIKAIKDANPGMKDNLVAGQVVRVPSQYRPVSTLKVTAKDSEKDKSVLDYEVKPKMETVVKEEGKTKAETPVVEMPKTAEVPPDKKTEDTGNAKPAVMPSKTGFHKVEGGQSLYGIAVKYGVLMADIRRWNGLTSDQLRSGQELIVAEPAYRDYLKKNRLDSIKLAEAKKSNTEKTPLPVPRPEDPTNGNLPEPKIANTGKRILETGVAEVLDGMDSNNKYLALHRTAPVGSLIQVKNMNNSQSIWVKVIGKLPDISANNRIIIKLSARAQEKLSPGGRQFIAEISYLAQ